MNGMTPDGLWASRRIRPDIDVSTISCEVGIESCAYHVESDDIFERDLACLVPSHEMFVDALRR